MQAQTAILETQRRLNSQLKVVQSKRNELFESILNEEQEKKEEEARLAHQEQKRIEAFKIHKRNVVRGIKKLIEFASQPKIHQILSQHIYVQTFVGHEVVAGLPIMVLCTSYESFGDGSGEIVREGHIVEISLTDISIVIRSWGDAGKFFGVDVFCEEIFFSSTDEEIGDFLSQAFCAREQEDGQRRIIRLLDQSTFVPGKSNRGIRNLVEKTKRPLKTDFRTEDAVVSFFKQCWKSSCFDKHLESIYECWANGDWYFDCNAAMGISFPPALSKAREIAAQDIAKEHFPDWFPSHALVLND